MGYRDWSPGDVVTEARIQELQDQGIGVFADATARDAAITAPAEGMFAYLTVTDLLTFYDGTSWGEYVTADVNLTAKNHADSAITVTTALTDVRTLTIPAGEPAAGDVYRVVMAGDFVQNGSGSHRWNFALYVGTGLLATDTDSTVVQNSPDTGYWRVEADIAFVSTAVERLTAQLFLGRGGSGTWGENLATGTLTQPRTFVGYKQLSEDSSSALDVKLAIQSNSSSATQTFTCRTAHIYRLVG